MVIYKSALVVVFHELFISLEHTMLYLAIMISLYVSYDLFCQHKK